MTGRSAGSAGPDLGLKAIAVLTAIGLFLWVRGEQESELRAAVRVQYELPSGLAFVDTPPTEVRIHIGGTRLRLSRFDPALLPPLRLNVARAKSGKMRVSPELFDLPKGLRVTYISPDVLSVATEPLLQRSLPVRVRMTNGRGLRVRAAPSHVTVSGARSRVAALDEIETRTVQARPGTTRVRLEAPKGVEVRPQRVEVKIAEAAEAHP
ncbi:MAG: hypothetical protein AABZ30_08960 [Myxococcota bacterium]